MEGKLDMLLTRETERTQAVSSIERRVRTVESRVTKAYGVAAGVSAVVTMCVYAVRTLMAH